MALRFLDEKRGVHPYQMEAAPRPNIFVFTVDMIPPEFHRQPSPCLEAMHMPAWRALQSDSVTYANAFSVSPLCGPSRASLFTGRYPYIFVNEERAHDGAEVALRSDDPIYPQYLKACGYLTGHVGKSHIGTESFMHAFGESCSPWNRWAPPIYDDPEYHQYLAERGIDGFTVCREIRGLKPDRRTPANSYGGWVTRKDGRPFPIEGTYPHYLVHRALALLESLTARSENRNPLYLHVDLFAPHQPFFIPGGFEDREKALRENVPLPQSYLNWQQGNGGWNEPQPKIYGTYRRSWGLYDTGTAADYAVANMLQMEVIDKALETFVERLREKGLYENSVILLTADHGEMNLEQGLVDKGVYGHPKAARIPLMLKLPENAEAGCVVDDDVCLLDVAPTFLELAGITPAARADGVSLLRFLEENYTGRPAPFVFEAGWHIAPNPAAAIHGRFPQGHFRYVYNAASTVDELYDLDDPTFRNLIECEEHTDIRTRLRRQLDTIFTADPRWRCYRQCFELEYAEELPSKQGDGQMFIPE